MDTTALANGSTNANTPVDDKNKTPPNGIGPKDKPSGKYRHVAAVHARQRMSCLSHDTEQSPSFLGFRNLMVIVLGIPLLPPFDLALGLI